MAERPYKATVSQAPGREAWTITFRHPNRLASDGKPLKMRRGLGTADESEARRLGQQMDELLADQSLWPPAARTTSERRFDERIVRAFYDSLMPSTEDLFQLRNELLPLPGAKEGYRKVLLLGPTGSGKTTVTRQLLGTKPRTEKFPSTSAGRTTFADTELVMAHGDFHAVVTFIAEDEAREYVEDCLAAAASEIHRGSDVDKVLDALLVHVEQRFRMNYLLGRGPRDDDDDDEESVGSDESDESDEADATDWLGGSASQLDLGQSTELLRRVLVELPPLVKAVVDEVEADVGPVEDVGDQGARDELVRDELDRCLRALPNFDALATALMDEVKLRFNALDEGELHKATTGWPRWWRWSNTDRDQFLRVIAKFSSNYGQLWGTLLTPLVNGLRVQGPFQPGWVDDRPRLVLLDGEGLGHTLDSSTSVPTAVVRQFASVDAILLVDNAEQPMLAAPQAALQQIAASGFASKLTLCFTHMDLVRGDNLPGLKARKRHVSGSLEQVFRQIGSPGGMGRSAEERLRRRLSERTVFLGGINRHMGSDKARLSNAATIGELQRLIGLLMTEEDRPTLGASRPVYDGANLIFAVQRAATQFHEYWNAKLGLPTKLAVAPAHWSTVKAMNRRLALHWQDHYAQLTPVADLGRELTHAIRQFIERPLRWEGTDPADDVEQETLDVFAQGVTSRIYRLVSERLYDGPAVEWNRAFALTGPGSTRDRARVIAHEIYERAAPIPGEFASPERTEFLQAVRAAVLEAAEEAGAVFLPTA